MFLSVALALVLHASKIKLTRIEELKEHSKNKKKAI
jgi:hypothetical protein